jgi:hypothetical protein
MKKSTKLICPGYETEPHECRPSDFYTDPARRGGGHSRLCKECHKARGREYFKTKYYPAHKEALIEAVIKRRKNEN